jgi:predicted amidohydrolase
MEKIIMARRITVSSLGQTPPRFPLEEKSIGYDELVENMIAFWKVQIERVLPDAPDLIVLPETCDDYAAMPKEIAKPFRQARGDRMLGALQEMAKQNNCNIAYATMREVADKTWRNVAMMIDRKGEIIGHYNKNHPTTYEIEDGILAGMETPLIQCDFGTVGFVICFDLNFDELRLKYKALRPDLLLFASMYHGGLMQSYWAYSCRAHFVGSVWSGNPNEIFSPQGEQLAHSTNYISNITATINLDCAQAHLDGNWGKLDALKKKYGRDVTIYDPGKLGSVLITSESETVDVNEMVREFEIELLDDYLERVLEVHHDPANRGA